MANLNNPNYIDSPAALFGHAGKLTVIDSKDIAVGTNNLQLNDLIRAFRVREGFCVTGVIFTTTDVDTNATPLVSLVVGDAVDDDRFVASTNIGRTGGVTNTLAATGTGYIFPADADVFIKVTAAAATAAAGVMRLQLIGYETKV